MSQPARQDYLRISAIAAALCALALVTAFAGAGVAALGVLAVVVGPISFYANQLVAGQTRGRHRRRRHHRSSQA